MLSAFKLARPLLLAAAAFSMAACDDDLGLGTWSAAPDTATLFSLSRPDLIGLPSAYDFINHTVFEVESPGATGQWDIALRDEGGQLALVPAGAFEGQDSRAALALITGGTFDSLDEAPGDTSAYSRNAVVVQAGQVYAVRTRRAGCTFTTAVRFGKMRIIAVDPVAGTVKFEAVVNPFCNDRSLVPPEDD